MVKKSGSTVWGAYHEDLEIVIEEIVKKLKEMGIPSPTKKEASALIAYRERNNLSFMNEKQIKEVIMKLRGY